jgi:hypothetical protein
MVGSLVVLKLDKCLLISCSIKGKEQQNNSTKFYLQNARLTTGVITFINWLVVETRMLRFKFGNVRRHIFGESPLD